jgi:tetratricopeptide (TPR) repeat protein
MFDDDNARREPQAKWSGKRVISLILTVFLANAVFFTIRPLIHESNPCKSANPYDRGIALDLYGDRSAAVAAYTEELKARPQNIEALKNRGYDYAELGQLDAAAADLTQALEFQPHDWYLMTRRADVYLKLGQFDRAMADLTKAVETAPDTSLTWDARGNAYLKHGDLDAAIDDYTHSLAAGRQNHVDFALYPRGVAYLRAGKFDLAKADFTAYVAAHNGDPDAARGRDCAEQGSNTGDCAIPYPPRPNPMIDKLLDAGSRSLSGCEQS